MYSREIGTVKYGATNGTLRRMGEWGILKIGRFRFLTRGPSATHRGANATRIRDLALARALVDEYQPRSIHLSSVIYERGLDAGHRLWALNDDQGSILGLVSISRWVRDRWQAAPLIFEPRAGALAATLIDRGPAWSVLGALEDTNHVYPHLTRKANVEPRMLAFFSGPAPIPDFEYDDPRIRHATRADLPALYSLYEAFESDAIPTRPRVRSYVRECFGRGPLLVATVGADLVGAIRIDAQSEDYLLWGGLTVAPEFRNRGIGASLAMTSICETRTLGKGACMIKATTNPMSFRQLEPGIAMGALHGQLWTEIPLRPPIRIRGQGRARRLLEAIEGRAIRRRPEFNQGVRV